MLEHLVQSHLGGYYISDSEIEDIEEYCETCGDYDTVVASWNPLEENGRLNGLLKYFMIDTLNTREDIDKKVEEIEYYIEENREIIPFLFNDIENNTDEVNTIVSYLYENQSISEDEYNKIIHISKIEEERQHRMVMHFSKSMFTKDESGHVKVLKLSNKK